MTSVIALADGHDGDRYRTAGEEFEVDLEANPRLRGSTWFAPIDDEQAATARTRRVDPNAPPPGAGPRRASRAGPDGARPVGQGPLA